MIYNHTVRLDKDENGIRPYCTCGELNAAPQNSTTNALIIGEAHLHGVIVRNNKLTGIRA